MDKNLCLQIYLSSPKSYNTLKAFLHLPSKPTLLKAVSGIKMEPGFSVAVLNAIKLVASKLKIHDRYCILSFDEITLKQSLSYDKKSDYIVGFENYGSYTELKMFPEYATHGLVFMVRGLCKKWKKWKQVIGYFFSSHTTPGFMLCTLVMEALSKLFDCGLIPVAVVCDGGANNVVCYKKFMKVTEERPYIICQDKKVFTLFDVPHLLKCLRNNFRKYDVKFQGGKIASWNHIVSLWEFDRKMPHRCVPKLTDRHVNVDCLSAMSVKLAAQVFSHSVASGLCYLSALNGLPASASLTADFCSNINILFDSLNSRTLKHSNPFLAGVTKSSIHLKTWKEKMDFIKGIEFQTEKKNIFPKRRGGNNDHPTAYDFQQRMRILMAQNIISTSKLSNCEPDNDTVLIPTELLTVIDNTEPGNGSDVNDMEIDFDDPLLVAKMKILILVLVLQVHHMMYFHKIQQLMLLDILLEGH
ncbi:uncharacterized protein LOC118190622 [Stegodyphus dumicola]|uniref:uncharacterized protein LOC118190622 n=1 Tax=Stegodyphus dumicola TaxID=202533 RepID=UPI0015A959F6|nr:uncharacterized protein LOC118190622 [Stegodyphus dumicola]